MVTRDVNHPSILFWDNGNEGGFNTDLDNVFARFAPGYLPHLSRSVDQHGAMKAPMGDMRNSGTNGFGGYS